MVFQDLALWPHMTVRTTLDFVLRESGARPTSGDRVQAMLTKASLQASPWPTLPTLGTSSNCCLAGADHQPRSSSWMSRWRAWMCPREQFIETLLRLVQVEPLSLLYVTTTTRSLHLGRSPVS